MQRRLRQFLPGGRFSEVPETRSRIMRAIRSHGNRSTEMRLRSALMIAQVRGWILNTSDIEGKPDFYFPREKLAIFLDGCFWHGCPRCARTPKTNAAFWKSKIGWRRRRDAKITRRLKTAGIGVVRVWEHDLADARQVVAQIVGLIRDRGYSRTTRHRYAARRIDNPGGRK